MFLKKKKTKVFQELHPVTLVKSSYWLEVGLWPAGPNWGGLAWCMFTFPTSVDEEAREKRV